MARKEQTGGGARPGRSSGGRVGRGHASKCGTSGRVRARTKRLTVQPPRQAQPSTSAERPSAGSAWSGAAGAGASVSPLLALTAGPPQAGAMLTLVGAEQTTLRDALQAWGAAQDQATNRAWRRPGGLARMAGL
ncbi:MAG TPA: hypothetical protein VE338_01160 [Ktedonobacterales bacterium]|nr:hypothetical protein [Ktedonobacterales bacterium]